MISFLLLVKVLQPDEISGSSRSGACVAKVTTDATFQELDVTELSSPIAA
jgi:hypothetical protein